MRRKSDEQRLGGIIVEKYSDVYELINNEEKAEKYFDCLPEYVKDSIVQRASSVNSFDSLCSYAENLVQGDC